MRFWILWGFDALVAGIAVAFFFVGLADGSVSSFNILTWTVLLAALGAVLGGSLWLRSSGHPSAATGLLFVLAVPAFLGGTFLVLLVVLNPRWN